MTKIIFPDKTSQHRWHRSSCQTQISQHRWRRSSYHAQAHEADSTNHFASLSHKLHRSASDAASTPQMAQIALPDAVPHGRDMAHISSFQMQARGIDGTNRFDRHKLHGTDGTDHLSRRKLAAQMAQITWPDTSFARMSIRSVLPKIVM